MSRSPRRVSLGGITWTRHRRGIGRVFWVPDRLGVLPLAEATRVVTVGRGPAGRGSQRTYDLGRVAEREEAYADLMTHADPQTMSACLNGPYLVASWHRLVLPWAIERAWQPVIGAMVCPGLSRGRLANRD